MGWHLPPNLLTWLTRGPGHQVVKPLAQDHMVGGRAGIPTQGGCKPFPQECERLSPPSPVPGGGRIPWVLDLITAVLPSLFLTGPRASPEAGRGRDAFEAGTAVWPVGRGRPGAQSSAGSCVLRPPACPELQPLPSTPSAGEARAWGAPGPAGSPGAGDAGASLLGTPSHRILERGLKAQQATERQEANPETQETWQFVNS